jgi:hypothetical protein
VSSSPAGTFAGVVVECEPAVAQRLTAMPLARLTVTPAGRLYDREAQRYVSARVVELPHG